MEKSSSQKRREAYLKALGIATEKDFAEWRKSGRYPVIVIHSLPAQIHQPLLKDPNISSTAKVLFGIYSVIGSGGKLQTTQKDIALWLNRTERTVRTLNKELKGAGWIHLKKIGFGFPDIVYLHDMTRFLRASTP